MTIFLPFLQKKSSIDFLIAGLGNPTPKYFNTRHNAGFLALDFFAEKEGISFPKQKFHALVGRGDVGENSCMLLKPTTFMNNSGVAIEEARNYYKIPVQNCIVLYDDIDIPFGTIRIRTKGSAGGHNGIKSIICETGSEEFIRIKIGVGKPSQKGYDLVNWVLSQFSQTELKTLKQKTFDSVHKALLLIMQGEVEKAMNQYSNR